MPGAIDGARGAIEPVVEPDTVNAGEAAVVSEAHVALLMADQGLAVHEPMGLSGAERAAANALGDAMALDGATAVDVCAALLEVMRAIDGDSGALPESRSLLRSSLSEAKGGG
jgi:hypothetical protein